MAKYEKFEKWMIGKKISVGDCQGVVLGRHFPSIVPSGVVCIQYKIGDGPTDWRWVELKCVTFLEETSPIPWEVGQVVWDVASGKGEVVRVGEGVHVKFESDNTTYTFTADGSYDDESVRTLFFSEPTIIADAMPPKKPFVPKLKEGDEVLVVTDLGEKGQRVVRETEDVLYTVLTDYKKLEILAVYRIGEEIKFQ